MSGISRLRNIGAYLVSITSIWPQSASAGTINGNSIDLQAHDMPQSMMMHTHVGTLGGAPSTTSVQSTLQTSSDNSTWANYTDPDTGAVAQGTALTATNTGGRLNIDLSNISRYIRIQTVVSFTGGTSPTAIIAAEAILGGEPMNPAI